MFQVCNLCQFILFSSLFCYHMCLINVFSFIGQFECICVLVLGGCSVQSDTSWQHCWAGTKVCLFILLMILYSSSLYPLAGPSCAMSFHFILTWLVPSGWYQLFSQCMATCHSLSLWYPRRIKFQVLCVCHLLYANVLNHPEFTCWEFSLRVCSVLG
jgi:hypothetical protein